MTLELDLDDIKKLFSSFGYELKIDGRGAYGEGMRDILKNALAFGVERSIGEDRKIYEDDWTLMQPINGPAYADGLVELLEKKINVYRGKNAAQMMIAYDLYIAGECTR